MAKNNQKCLRISNDILEIVDNYRGVGFNDKFENLCTDYFCDIEKRKKDLANLDKLISLKKSQLDEYENKVRKMDSLVFKFDTIIKTALECNLLAENMPVVSQSIELQKCQAAANEIQVPRKIYKHNS